MKFNIKILLLISIIILNSKTLATETKKAECFYSFVYKRSVCAIGLSEILKVSLEGDSKERVEAIKKYISNKSNKAEILSLISESLTKWIKAEFEILRYKESDDPLTKYRREKYAQDMETLKELEKLLRG